MNIYYNFLKESRTALVVTIITCLFFVMSFQKTHAAFVYSRVDVFMCTSYGEFGGCEGGYYQPYAEFEVSTPKDTYAPGETIAIYGYAYRSVGTNAGAVGVGIGDLNGRTDFCGGDSWCDGTLYITAPFTPGTYSIPIIGASPAFDQWNSVASTLYYTVEAPPVVGVCSATHYSCAAGTSISNVSNAATWTWSCSASGGNASCSEAKPLPTVNINFQ